MEWVNTFMEIGLVLSSIGLGCSYWLLHSYRKELKEKEIEIEDLKSGVTEKIAEQCIKRVEVKTLNLDEFDPFGEVIINGEKTLMYVGDVIYHGVNEPGRRHIKTINLIEK